ncbi:MAG: hypothetical protein KC413_11220, partial [Anaerolineales bacterium]|nr:hypothetical protein [Anaerolineales bacterium]
MTTNIQLIQEKLVQATAILNELDIDLWLTFVRETSMQPDPVLDLIAGVDVTWQSAFLLSRTGQHTAIIGHFDAENVQALGAYRVIGYHEGIRQPLREAIAAYQPTTLAINYSENDVAADGLSHGMYLALLDHLRDTP